MYARVCVCVCGCGCGCGCGCLPACPSVCLSVCLLVCLCLRPRLCPRLYVCVSACVSKPGTLAVCQCVCVCACAPLYMIYLFIRPNRDPIVVIPAMSLSRSFWLGRESVRQGGTLDSIECATVGTHFALTYGFGTLFLLFFVRDIQQ